MPVEPDRVSQVLEGGVHVAKRRAARLLAPGVDGERETLPAAGRVDGSAVRRQELASYVGHREVVGGVLRLLPDEQGPGGVGDELAAEVGANALRALLDAHASALGGLRGCHAHLDSFRSAAGTPDQRAEGC